MIGAPKSSLNMKKVVKISNLRQKREGQPDIIQVLRSVFISYYTSPFVLLTLKQEMVRAINHIWVN